MTVNRAWMFFVAVLALDGPGAAAEVATFDPKVISVGRCVTPDGRIKRNALIAIEKGKIKRVVYDQPEPEAAHGVSYPDGVAMAGLIDIRSQIGAWGQTGEGVDAIDPDASAIDAVDWNHRDFRAAAAAGVTTVMISPAPNNLVSGVAATVKTARDPRYSPVLRDEGPLLFALGPSVWSYDRAPTSRAGSLWMLNDALDAAAGGGGSARLQSFVRGKLKGLAVCRSAMDVSSALSLFGERRLTVSIVYNGDEHDLASELAGRASAAVVGPYSFSLTPHHLATAGVLASSGVPLAFAGNMPDRPAASLRITASLAVRHGMDAATARRAMTSIPALIAGVSNRVGAIHPGMDADIVIFSKDPLRLDARVLAVYIDGVRVHAASRKPMSSFGVSP